MRRHHAKCWNRSNALTVFKVSIRLLGDHLELRKLLLDVFGLLSFSLATWLI